MRAFSSWRIHSSVPTVGPTPAHLSKPTYKSSFRYLQPSCLPVSTPTLSGHGRPWPQVPRHATASQSRPNICVVLAQTFLFTSSPLGGSLCVPCSSVGKEATLEPLIAGVREKLGIMQLARHTVMQSDHCNRSLHDTALQAALNGLLLCTVQSETRACVVFCCDALTQIGRCRQGSLACGCPVRLMCRCWCMFGDLWVHDVEPGWPTCSRQHLSKP